jgi:AcrR family transcriptional regulator
MPPSPSPAPRSLVAQHPQVGSRLEPALDAQRARLLDAMARVVGERGYGAASVADVVRAAGVSRTTFYELFSSKEECFLEAYRHGVDVLVDRVREAVRAAPDEWRAQLRAGIRAYLTELASEPVFARTYLLEIHAAGGAALDARAEALRRFAARYRATFERAHAGRRPPPEEALLVLGAGTEQLAAERVRAGRAAALEELEDVFCRCAEAVLLGADTDHDRIEEG